MEDLELEEKIYKVPIVVSGLNFEKSLETPKLINGTGYEVSNAVIVTPYLLISLLIC